MARDSTRPPQLPFVTSRPVYLARPYIRIALLLVAFIGLCTGTVAAQEETPSPGSAFCDTEMAATIQNIFTIIQFGGPLVGGALALGATVAMPVVRRSDRKKGLRTVQMQGLLWGVIVAPLGTEIVQFILDNVVVGGTSCGF
jgi:hypothetical protein